MTAAGDVVVRVGELTVLDVGSLSSPGELEAVSGRIAAVRSWLDALQAKVAQRAGELAAAGRGPGPVEVVQRGGGMSAREARTVARRAEIATALPSFGDALADGRLSAEHVDVLGRAMLALDVTKQAELAGHETALLRAATSSDPDTWAKRVRGFVTEIDTSHIRTELERAKKLTRLRIWQDNSRMVQLSGSIEPVAGERLWNAVHREAARLIAANQQLPVDERLSDEQATAHALVNLVAGGHAQAHANPVDLVVHVGLERLTGEPGGQQTCETSRGTELPVDWVRQMAHEAQLIPLVIDEAGPAVELDRASRQRLATFVQRLMLRAMHDTCMVTGCDVPFDDCEIHHLVAFNGTNTRLGNLGPLCSRHHHAVHDRGWQITLDAARNITITLPDGTVHAHEKYRPPGDPPGDPPRVPSPRHDESPVGVDARPAA